MSCTVMNVMNKVYNLTQDTQYVVFNTPIKAHRVHYEAVLSNFLFLNRQVSMFFMESLTGLKVAVINRGVTIPGRLSSRYVERRWSHTTIASVAASPITRGT